MEHVAFLIAALENNRIQLEFCTPKSLDFWENFLWRYRPHLIYNFPYSRFELPFYEWVNLLQAVSWNYSDLLVTVLAIGVKFRFDQFNQYFKEIVSNEKLMTDENFKTIRVHYYQLIDLIHFINSQVSSLILISLGHNMIVLIIKIFSALK